MFKMKFFLPALIFALFIVLLPVSAQETETIELVTMTDDLGREVEIPHPLTSVITLAPSLTEMLFP